MSLRWKDFAWRIKPTWQLHESTKKMVGCPRTLCQSWTYIPKFENKLLDNVAKYLDLFEDMIKQNQYDQSVWPLALRTAVIGTKLEPIVSMGGTYEEFKKEILVAHGQTAEKLWHQLITTSQGSESFRQWSGVRVADKLAQFFRLAVNVNDRGQEHDDTVTEEEKCTPLRGKASRISVDDLMATTWWNNDHRREIFIKRKDRR